MNVSFSINGHHKNAIQSFSESHQPSHQPSKSRESSFYLLSTWKLAERPNSVSLISAGLEYGEHSGLLDSYWLDLHIKLRQGLLFHALLNMPPLAECTDPDTPRTKM